MLMIVYSFSANSISKQQLWQARIPTSLLLHKKIFDIVFFDACLILTK